jgi:hypothetical protein
MEPSSKTSPCLPHERFEFPAHVLQILQNLVWHEHASETGSLSSGAVFPCPLFQSLALAHLAASVEAGTLGTLSAGR